MQIWLSICNFNATCLIGITCKVNQTIFNNKHRHDVKNYHQI